MNKESQENWDNYLMGIAEEVSKKSKDPSTKVGCVITTPDGAIRSTGFNGFPSGAIDDDPEMWKRPRKYLRVVHAEQNAIALAAKHGTALDGCVAYVTLFPCATCAKFLIQAGIKRVIAYEASACYATLDTWKEEWKEATCLFEETGLEYQVLPRPSNKYSS